jgi:hypothetical protein
VKVSEDELGAIYALIERFEKQRLPRLLEIKQRIDKGGVFSESDIQFMYQVTREPQRSKQLVDRHPEWHKFCAECTQTATFKDVPHYRRTQLQA